MAASVEDQPQEESMEDDSGLPDVIKLLVSDLNENVSAKLVGVYFASRDVQVVDISPPLDGKCIVSVTELKDVEKFCARKHKIDKQPVKIKPCPVKVPDPNTIEVLYPPELESATLEAYFSGPLSGEREEREEDEDDEDKTIEFIKVIEPGKCHIKFEFPEDAACVLAKKTHEFLKNELTVNPVMVEAETMTPPTQNELPDDDIKAPPTKIKPRPPDEDLLPVEVTPPTNTELPPHVKPSVPSGDIPLLPPPLIDEDSDTTTSTQLPVGSTGANPDVVPVNGKSNPPVEEIYEKNRLIIRNIPEKAAKMEFIVDVLEDVLNLDSESDFSLELEKDQAQLVFTKQYTVEELKSFCDKITSRKMKGQNPLAELSELPDNDIKAPPTKIKPRPPDEDSLPVEVTPPTNTELPPHVKPSVPSGDTPPPLVDDDGTTTSTKVPVSEDGSTGANPDCVPVNGGSSDPPIEDDYEKNRLIIRNIPEKAAKLDYLVDALGDTLELDSESDFSLELEKDEALLIFTEQYTVEELKSFCDKITSRKMKGQNPVAELKRKVVTPDIAAQSKDKGNIYERNKLIIRNIPEGVNDTYFRFYLDGLFDFEEDDGYSFELLKTGALVTFTKEYSIEELNAFCEMIASKEMKGQVLVVELCKTNCTVLIMEIAEESFASQDGLKVYFGSKKAGGGKDVVEEVVMLGNKRAKVTFKSSQTVKSVLSKDHSTLGPIAKIIACSPLIDVEEADSEETSDDPPLSSPTEKRKKSSPSEDETATEPKKIKRDRPSTRIDLDLLIAKYLDNNCDLLNGIGKEVNATASVVDRNKGVIELVMNDIDTSPDDLEAAVTTFCSLLFNTVRRADIQFPPEANAEASNTIVSFSASNNLPVDLTGDNCIGIAGKTHQIDDIKKTVHDLCDRIVPASAQFSLTAEDWEYFTKHAIKATQKAHPNVKIGFNATNTLTVDGSRRDVTRFKDSLDTLIRHATVPVQISKLGMAFLKQGKGVGILKTLIKHDNVLPFFSEDRLSAGTCNSSLFLLCPHDDARYAESVSVKICTTILEKEFKFPQYFYTDVADSHRFNNFKQKMSERYAFLCAVERNSVFKLVCRAEVQNQLSDLFSKFVAEECSITEKMTIKRGVWRLLNSTMEKKLNKLEAEMKEKGVQVLKKSKPTAAKPFLAIKGDRNIVAQLKEKFVELQKSVHELEFTVARPGIVKHFYKDAGGQFALTGIETSAKVCIELEVQKDHADDLDSSTGKGSSHFFKKVCAANTTQGVTVNLYTGDITQFNKAEVIVNAANESLSHGSGVAGAIADKGGSIISKDSRDYVNKRGNVPTGSAVIFNRVGNLPPPYQAIVHAVGPVWRGVSDKDKSTALLRKTVKNTLKQAKAFNSIAIPAISSGMFGFPVDIAANSLVQGVIEFIDGNAASCNLNEINFVIFDDNIPPFKQAIKEHLRNVHVLDEPQPSGGTTKSTPTTDQSSPQMSLRSRSRRSSSKPDTAGIVPTPSLPSISTAKKSKNELLKCIKITKDDILKHQCEVLVNTTDQQLGFGGYVGRVLLKAAGTGLQDECQAIPKPIQYGDVVTTKAHQLQSKHIVHVVLPGYGGTQSETALRGVVNKCLQECTRLNARSISIPSIGAGNLGYPSDTVASCLLDEAYKYLSDNNGQTSLQLIHFVIFDGTVHQAFQQHYSKMPIANSSSTFDTVVSETTRTPRTKPSTRTPIPSSRSTPSGSSTSAGKKRSSKKPSSSLSHGLMQPTPRFANSCSFALPNDICLHVIEGDITDQSTDVIVNTTNPELLLTGGGVAGALLMKGGQALQDACDRTRASNMRAAEGKVVETRCEGIGQLRCKSIFHIVFEGKEQRKLVKTISACLDRAEKMRYTSIAIPAIGTGVIAYPSYLAAEGIVKALKQFTKNGPKHVKEIRMVIFQPAMFKEFTDAFKKIEKESDGILNYIYDKSAKFLDKGGQLLDKSGQIIEAFFIGDQRSSYDDNDDSSMMDWTSVTHDDTIIGSEEMEYSDDDDDDGDQSEEDFEHSAMTVDEDMLSNISLDTEVTMYIYGESEPAVKRAEKSLRGFLNNLIVSEEVDDVNIPELSQSVLSELEEFALKHDVEIDIDNDSHIHTIKLHGCQTDVVSVKERIRDSLTHVHQFKTKKEVASTVSKHIKWVRQLSDGPEDYDEVFSFEIEQAYQNKKPSYHNDKKGDEFMIDFSKMEETDLDNGDTVKVVRVDFAQSYEKPLEWAPMPKDSNNREVTVHLVTLKQTDKEYKDALAKFDVTMKSRYSQIVSIERIQNPVLYGQYMARKKEMEKRNPPGCQNERWLFHGTNSGVIDAINTQGLNRSFKSTTAYGQGVYFARDAWYSNGYAHPDPSNQHRRMYLAQVLTGEFEVGHSKMLVPPAKKNAQNKHILYDSTVDTTSNPSIFVVYSDPQAYTAYLITYK